MGTSVLAAMAAVASPPVTADPAPANGQIAFQSSRDGTDNIHVINPDGSNEVRLTYETGQHGYPAWSPDGTRIAFHSTRDGNVDIYVMDADGTDWTKLTSDSATDMAPAWSPDGTKIAFLRLVGGAYEIYVMNANGTDQHRLTDTTFSEGYPAWSPDGTMLAFLSTDDGDREIYVMDADGTNRTQLTVNSAIDEKPVWSPDGSRIAYHSNLDGDHEVFVMNADGTGRAQLTTTFRSASPAWSPDGTKIAFATFSGGNWEIFTMNADGSNQANLTNSTGTNVHPAWGVVPTPDETAPIVTITTPADGDVYTLGSTVTVAYTCEDEPDGSGLASCVGDLPDGSLLDTSTVGAGSFTVIGTDLVGNSATVAHSYSVVWDFDGFFMPVDNPPVVNTARAGRAIPVKFSLSGDQGLEIFGSNPVSREVACDTTVTDTIEETVTAGSSSLSYDAPADQYTYVWKTSKTWADTCRQLVLTLADGTQHVADFRF